MGGKGSKPKHVLHYHRIEENTLWLFYPEKEQYVCYPVQSKTGPFFFGNLETVSVPSLNTIFVVGGAGLRSVPDYSIKENPFNARLGEKGIEIKPSSHKVRISILFAIFYVL